MSDMLSFISLENDNLALQSRKLLQSVQEIDIEVKKGGLTTEKADIYIKNMKIYINQLETIKERDGKEEIYFNWLKDE
ncbi:hypothetical protein [Pseudogracilibacillus sp. SO10305]|uniref:hypothetical protein n=1 Tax=Pseudogracilibacillus sp. SO10305 TaxID=3098292 RepID=UPI00300DD2B9